MAQENAINIQFQNSFFAEPLFYFQGQQNFRKFSDERLIQGQKKVSRDLHGDGGAAALLATGDN